MSIFSKISISFVLSKTDKKIYLNSNTKNTAIIKITQNIPTESNKLPLKTIKDITNPQHNAIPKTAPIRISTITLIKAKLYKKTLFEFNTLFGLYRLFLILFLI